jgi:hypothetical protein
MTEERCTDCMVNQGRDCHCRQATPRLFWPILLGLFLWWFIIVGALHLWSVFQSL